MKFGGMPSKFHSKIRPSLRSSVVTEFAAWRSKTQSSVPHQTTLLSNPSECQNTVGITYNADAVARQESMPEINPCVLSWARETAGLTLFDAAKKLRIRNAHGQEPAERLAALESGAHQPTRSMLTKMSKCYRRPLITFYMDKPPRPSNFGRDFRTLNGEISARQNALVRTLVRHAIAHQGIVRSLLEDEHEAPVAFVGTVSMSSGQSHALTALHSILDDSTPTKHAILYA